MTDYVLDGLQVLLEKNASGVTQTRYVPALVMIVSGAPSYYLEDRMGSILGLANSSQSVTDTFNYDAWGNSIQRQGSTVEAYQWVGEESYYYDNQLAIYLLGHRYINSMAGRFISRDPLGNRDKASFSVYVYVFNNPFRYNDPNGKAGHIVSGALFGCGAGVTWSLFSSWLAGDNGCQCLCKSFSSCFIGAILGGLAAANPAWAGCLAGTAGGLITNGIGYSCNSLCSRSGNQKLMCAAISAIATALAGCLLKGITTQVEYTVAQAVGNMVGYDINGYCEYFKS